MPGIGIGELVVIFLLLLVFVGPARLPQVARTLGRAMGEVRRATDELKNALYLEDVRQRRAASPPRPRAGAAQPRPRSPAVREVELPDEGPPRGADPYEGANDEAAEIAAAGGDGAEPTAPAGDGPADAEDGAKP